MAKKPRWICLEPKCGHIVSSKPTGGVFCLCSLWCGRSKYLVPDQIDLRRPPTQDIDPKTLPVFDWFDPANHVQLTGEGWRQMRAELKARQEAAERWGHPSDKYVRMARWKGVQWRRR